jgi:oxygen-independent coproporphyrinogen-3 oxidase
MSEVAEDQSEKEYAMLHNRLTEAGFEHYEVSNYALEGFRAKHNSSYWQGVEYLGVGVGAHSFNGEVRHYSEQSIEEYVERREYVVEQLTPRDHYNEYVMTALRRKEGIDCRKVAENFGEKALQRVKEGVAPWVESGDVIEDGKSIKIPAERFMISDAVIESLFEV